MSSSGSWSISGECGEGTGMYFVMILTYNGEKDIRRKRRKEAKFGMWMLAPLTTVEGEDE